MVKSIWTNLSMWYKSHRNFHCKNVLSLIFLKKFKLIFYLKIIKKQQNLRNFCIRVTRDKLVSEKDRPKKQKDRV